MRLFVRREEAWEKRIVVSPANTLRWARCISIQAVTNNPGCRYVSRHQRDAGAKVFRLL